LRTEDSIGRQPTLKFGPIPFSLLQILVNGNLFQLDPGKLLPHPGGLKGSQA